MQTNEVTILNTRTFDRCETCGRTVLMKLHRTGREAVTFCGLCGEPLHMAGPVADETRDTIRTAMRARCVVYPERVA